MFGAQRDFLRKFGHPSFYPIPSSDGLVLGVAVDQARNIYVADSPPFRSLGMHGRLSKLDRDGQLLQRIYIQEVFPGEYGANIYAVAVNRQGDIYLLVHAPTGYGDVRFIVKLDAAGKFVTAVRAPGCCGRSSELALDGQDNLYHVADRAVRKYAPDLSLTKSWDTPPLNAMYGLAVDGEGFLYVSDQGSDLLALFDMEGAFFGVGHPGLAWTWRWARTLSIAPMTAVLRLCQSGPSPSSARHRCGRPHGRLHTCRCPWLRTPRTSSMSPRRK